LGLIQKSGFIDAQKDIDAAIDATLLVHVFIPTTSADEIRSKHDT
jgi:hypothetical protein